MLAVILSISPFCLRPFGICSASWACCKPFYRHSALVICENLGSKECHRYFISSHGCFNTTAPFISLSSQLTNAIGMHSRALFVSGEIAAWLHPAIYVSETCNGCYQAIRVSMQHVAVSRSATSLDRWCVYCWQAEDVAPLQSTQCLGFYLGDGSGNL